VQKGCSAGFKMHFWLALLRYRWGEEIPEFFSVEPHLFLTKKTIGDSWCPTLVASLVKINGKL